MRIGGLHAQEAPMANRRDKRGIAKRRNARFGKNAADPKAAHALITFLQGLAIDQALQDYGIEKGHIGK
jgi:hypothetical protein